MKMPLGTLECTKEVVYSNTAALTHTLAACTHFAKDIRTLLLQKYQFCKSNIHHPRLRYQYRRLELPVYDPPNSN